MRRSLVISESINSNLHSEKQEELNSKNNITVESNNGKDNASYTPDSIQEKIKEFNKRNSIFENPIAALYDKNIK